MTPFEFPDDVKKSLAHCGPGEWVPVPQRDGSVYFVCASVPVIDDAYVRREVNKGLDSTDKYGSKPMNKEEFKKRARERFESPSS